MKIFLSFSCILLVVLGMLGVANATLWDRGGGLIYDDVLDVTWLQNANYGAGSVYDDGLSNSDGLMSWDNANDWAESLVFQGYDDWRLPNTSFSVVIMPGDETPNDYELDYMFYNNLGGVEYSFPGTSFTDSSSGEVRDFTGLTPDLFWLNNGGYTAFDFSDGREYIIAILPGGPLPEFKAWALRNGDSSPVFEPSTIVLMGLGLVGLAGFGRRKFRK